MYGRFVQSPLRNCYCPVGAISDRPSKKNGLHDADRSFYAVFCKLRLGGKIIAHVLYGDELYGLGELEAKRCLNFHCQQHDGQRVQLEVFHELGLGGDGGNVNSGSHSFDNFFEFFKHDNVILSCCGSKPPPYVRFS